MSGIIPSRGYYISDANASGTGGQLTMDPHTGLLGLTDGKGGQKSLLIHHILLQPLIKDTLNKGHFPMHQPI